MASTLQFGTNVSHPPGGAYFSLGNDVVLFANAGVPTGGTSGTLVGIAGPGSICIDYSNAKAYINTNTAASPTWTVVGAQTT